MTNCQINKDCTDKEECIDGKCQVKPKSSNASKILAYIFGFLLLLLLLLGSFAMCPSNPFKGCIHMFSCVMSGGSVLYWM